MQMNENYKWTAMKQPTRFPVYDNGKKVLDPGLEGVEVAFGQSSKPLLDKKGKPTGKMQNVYRYQGKIYNA